MMVTGLSGQAAKAVLPKVNTAAPAILAAASFTVLTNFMLVSLKRIWLGCPLDREDRLWIEWRSVGWPPS
jgi:hypothetical protein